jgi:hypothetical protein
MPAQDWSLKGSHKPILFDGDAVPITTRMRGGFTDVTAGGRIRRWLFILQPIGHCVLITPNMRSMLPSVFATPDNFRVDP